MVLRRVGNTFRLHVHVWEELLQLEWDVLVVWHTGRQQAEAARYLALKFSSSWTRPWCQLPHCSTARRSRSRQQWRSSPYPCCCQLPSRYPNSPPLGSARDIRWSKLCFSFMSDTLKSMWCLERCIWVSVLCICYRVAWCSCRCCIIGGTVWSGQSDILRFIRCWQERCTFSKRKESSVNPINQAIRCINTATI